MNPLTATLVFIGIMGIVAYVITKLVQSLGYWKQRAESYEARYDQLEKAVKDYEDFHQTVIKIAKETTADEDINPLITDFNNGL